MSRFNDVPGVWVKHEGTKIDEHSRNQWGIECLDGLMRDEHEVYYYTTSGDSIVIAIRHRDGTDQEIEVYDCKIQRKMRFLANE